MSWRKLCDLRDVPMVSMRAFEVDGTKLLLLRGASSFAVIPDSCPHMAASLSEGIFDGEVLTCNKHLWQWSIADDGKAIGIAELDLMTYPTKEVDDVAYVDLSSVFRYEYELEAE